MPGDCPSIQAMLESRVQLEPEERAARIKEAIDACPMLQNEIAEAVGVSPQALTGWVKTGKIARDTMGKLARVCGRPVDFFLYVNWQEPTDWDDVLGFAQAAGLGGGIEAQEYAETHKLKFRADSLARKRLNPRQLAVVYGRGDSMLPRIHDGDAILFDQSSTKPQHKKLFVIAVPGVGQTEYNVKRCNILGGMVFFEALNPEADHEWIEPRQMNDPKQPITIIGRVRWIGSWED